MFWTKKNKKVLSCQEKDEKIKELNLEILALKNEMKEKDLLVMQILTKIRTVWNK